MQYPSRIPTAERIALSIREVSAATGLSAATINRRIKDGTLTSAKVCGRRVVTPENARLMIERASAIRTHAVAEGA